MSDVYAAGTIQGAAAVSGSLTWAQTAPYGSSPGESGPDTNPLASALRAGLGVISQQQQVTFRRYVRVVLPLDGFVFWVRADLLGPSAQFGTSPFNTAPFNAPPEVVTPACELTVLASLHVTTTNNQDEAESFSVNRIHLTSTQEVQELNQIAPTEMWVACLGDYRYAFTVSHQYYKQAGLHHYEGDALYPVMEPQLVDDLTGFDGRSLVVSNSLPIWLGLTTYFPLYPSFAVPDNIRPPYGVIHISPDATRALQPVPYYDATGSRYQLMADRVRVTLYGVRANAAYDWVDAVIGHSWRYSDIGLMSGPVIRDDKRTQAEVSVLAQKKTVDFEVSYQQSRVRDVARQLILTCIPTFEVVI